MSSVTINIVLYLELIIECFFLYQTASSLKKWGPILMVSDMPMYWIGLASKLYVMILSELWW